MQNNILEIKDVYKHYQQGSNQIDVLKGVNLQVKAGSIAAIIGESGSGKSTLLSIISGLDNPDRGKIMINNTDIASLNEKQVTSFRGQNMGIIFQQYHLMSHLSAFQNVKLPLEIHGRPQAGELASKALEQVGLKDRAHHLPHQLSGGEKQRVAIARAFVVQPSLLLADEPSGSLDHKTGEQIMSTLFQGARDHNMTMVLVTHNRQLAQKCDTIFELEQGVLHQR